MLLDPGFHRGDELFCAFRDGEADESYLNSFKSLIIAKERNEW